ncbi:MAG: pyruvate kinase [Pirellulales bacterium]|nr:pyruvate kinase [Pirellulales bacterium]
MPSAATYASRAATKIVATLGPASSGSERIIQMVQAGVDVFRINTAHGSSEEYEQHLADIKAARKATGQMVAVLVDLAGPKIRLQDLPDGAVHCREGAEFTFVRGENPPQTKTELTTTLPTLVDDLQVGDRIMLADGAVSMQVVETGEDLARCRVLQPGIIRSRQGVNLPGVKLSVPAMTDADREFAIWAARRPVDYVSLSFVRQAAEVSDLANLLIAHGSEARVCAKIEKPEALENLSAIVDAAGIVMVARGDLGVETDLAEMAVVQKQIIAICNQRQTPVIVATQMLDSMQHSRYPTRAEATDVTNAILDGADACMLSGETAIGEYPVETVAMMERIALAAEKMLASSEITRTFHDQHRPLGLHPLTHAVVHGVAEIVQRLDAKLVIAASHSGATALALSNLRMSVPILGVSDREDTLRRMNLYWGVRPMSGMPLDSVRKLGSLVADWGNECGTLSPGDHIVLVRGTHFGPDVHNTLVVHEVK